VNTAALNVLIQVSCFSSLHLRVKFCLNKPKGKDCVSVSEEKQKPKETSCQGPPLTVPTPQIQCKWPQPQVPKSRATGPSPTPGVSRAHSSLAFTRASMSRAASGPQGQPTQG
jgi:hypothetical protein